jgi:antitoxin ParD1/3/4
MAGSVDLGIQREAVRLIQEGETRLAALDASIARGIADAEGGQVQDIEVATAMLDAKYVGLLERQRAAS